MNEISSGWSIGIVEDAGEKYIDFINENCRTALTKIASAFNFEFEVNNKVINFKNAVGNLTAYSFKYGKNNGLYSIERRAFESQNVFTRVYGYGSTRNIPYTYRERAKRLVFESKYLEKTFQFLALKKAIIRMKIFTRIEPAQFRLLIMYLTRAFSIIQILTLRTLQ